MKQLGVAALIAVVICLIIGALLYLLNVQGRI